MEIELKTENTNSIESSYASMKSKSDIKSNKLDKTKKKKNERKFKKFDDNNDKIIVVSKNLKCDDRLLISDIDNIYMNLKVEPGLLKNTKYKMLFYFLINYTLFWFFCDMFAPLKNNYYCFNTNSSTFEVCNVQYNCMDVKTGIFKFIFLTNKLLTKTYTDIPNKETLSELEKVNEYFKLFFIKELSIYSGNNIDNFHRSSSFIDYYNTVIVVNKNENYNIMNAFKQVCRRQANLLILTPFSLIGFLIGNFIIGCLADLYGRKLLLTIIIFIQLISCLGVFFYYNILIKTADNLDPIIIPGLNYAYDVTFKNTTIRNNFFISEVSISFLDSYYSTHFTKISQLIVNDYVVHSNFHSTILILAFLICLISIGISSGNNIAISLSLETSVSDSLVTFSYCIIYLGFALSYYLHYLLTLITDDFGHPYLLISCALGYLLVSVFLLGIESPRHLFEFYDYESLTKLFLPAFSLREVETLFTSIHNPKVKHEIAKMKSNKLTSFNPCKNILFLAQRKKGRSFFLNRLRLNLDRKQLITYPFDIFYLFKEKTKNRSLILFSLVVNVSIVFFLIMFNLKSPLLSSRSDIYEYKDFINGTPFYSTIVLIFSNFFFYFFLKFFGINLIFRICFFMTCVFSLVFNIIQFTVVDPEDLNEYYFNDPKLLYNNYYSVFFGLQCVMTFFGYGLFFALFFYLTTYTSTLYRCSLYGQARAVMDIMTIMSLAISQYFEKNMLYVTLVSIVGFANSLFIGNTVQHSFIGDFRKIKIHNT
jgi:MFS family permease